MSDTLASTDPYGVESVQLETTVSGGVARVVLRGELDYSMLDQLNVALEGIPLEGTPVVHLDVADLIFADTGAVRRLAAFTAAAKHAGHQVKTIGANRTFNKVATVLDAKDDLGLA